MNVQEAFLLDLCLSNKLEAIARVRPAIADDYCVIPGCTFHVNVVTLIRRRV